MLERFHQRVLLIETNQPVWSNTTWLGALFLASAASTGVASMVLLDRSLRLNVSEGVIEHLEDLGIDNQLLWRLQELVAERIEAAGTARPAAGTDVLDGR